MTSGLVLLTTWVALNGWKYLDRFQYVMKFFKLYWKPLIFTQLKLYIGCSVWSYSSWQGPFYPPNMENKSWLPYYSQVFNYVEIDSTFYNIPSELMVRNWNRRTPNNFRFTAKFPKIITHEKRFKNVENKQLFSYYSQAFTYVDWFIFFAIPI